MIDADLETAGRCGPIVHEILDQLTTVRTGDALSRAEDRVLPKLEGQEAIDITVGP